MSKKPPYPFPDVLVPDKLFMDTETMTGYLKASFSYVSGLKPNPTKKKK